MFMCHLWRVKTVILTRIRWQATVQKMNSRLSLSSEWGALVPFDCAGGPVCTQRIFCALLRTSFPLGDLLGGRDTTTSQPGVLRSFMKFPGNFGLTTLLFSSVERVRGLLYKYQYLIRFSTRHFVCAKPQHGSAAAHLFERPLAASVRRPDTAKPQ